MQKFANYLLLLNGFIMVTADAGVWYYLNQKATPWVIITSIIGTVAIGTAVKLILEKKKT